MHIYRFQPADHGMPPAFWRRVNEVRLLRGLQVIEQDEAWLVPRNSGKRFWSSDADLEEMRNAKPRRAILSNNNGRYVAAACAKCGDAGVRLGHFSMTGDSGPPEVKCASCGQVVAVSLEPAES